MLSDFNPNVVPTNAAVGKRNVLPFRSHTAARNVVAPNGTTPDARSTQRLQHARYDGRGANRWRPPACRNISSKAILPRVEAVDLNKYRKRIPHSTILHTGRKTPMNRTGDSSRND